MHNLDDLKTVVGVQCRHHSTRQEAVLKQIDVACFLVKLLSEQGEPVLLLGVEPHFHLTVTSEASDALVHLSSQLVGNISHSLSLPFSFLEPVGAHIRTISGNLLGLSLKLFHFGLIDFHRDDDILWRECPESDIEWNAYTRSKTGVDLSQFVHDWLQCWVPRADFVVGLLGSGRGRWLFLV